MQHHQRLPIWVLIKHNLILLSTNKDEQNDRVLQKILIAYLASIVACVLLSLLVLTVTAFEIGLFQGPERQYESLEKVQVSKIFWGLTPHPQNPQLNDSLASLVRFQPLSSLYFTPWNIINFYQKISVLSKFILPQRFFISGIRYAFTLLSISVLSFRNKNCDNKCTSKWQNS